MKVINLSVLRTYICKDGDCYCPSFNKCPLRKHCSIVHVTDWNNKPLHDMDSFVCIMEYRKEHVSDYAIETFNDFIKRTSREHETS